MPAAAESKRRFRHISAAGMFFQGGAVAVDTSTLMAALVHQLTGSAFAVGAAAGIARFGWLFPQLFVAYYAQRSTRRLRFYMFGAFGRVACLAALALLLWLAADLPGAVVVASFFALWIAYAFISGIVAVPYNDIVARSIPSERRSRMLALRFFGGGLLALAVAAVARPLLETMPFPAGYAVIVLLGAALLLSSAIAFVCAGEPEARVEPSVSSDVRTFVRAGFETLARDHSFRLFLVAQWLGGAAAMALPFYILQATGPASNVAILLGAQTAGALLSNPLWGWWGDRRGKRELLELVAALGALAPALALGWLVGGERLGIVALAYFVPVFVLVGAVGNGSTIAYLGYLMEISPDDRRPAYSGFFNTLAAPAALLPMVGGAIAQAGSYATVFALSLAAAVVQFLTVRSLRRAR